MSTRLPPISFQVLRWSLVGRWSGTITRHEAWNIRGGPRSETYSVTENTQITLLPAPQSDEEENVRGARVISPIGSLRESPLVYPLWMFTRVFPATYTSAYSQIDDWIEIDKAAQVANRGQGSGDGAKVTFKLFHYGDAEPPREVTVDVWRKIDLRTQDLKLQSTSEWNAATNYPLAVAHEEDLAFTTHTLLSPEGFRVRSTDPQPHPDIPGDLSDFVSGDDYTGSGEIVVDLQAAPIGTFLWFDGVDVLVVDIESETILRSWPAFSGRPEATASRDPSNQTGQHAPSIGPIPEGLYGIVTDESTSRETAESTWDWIKWTAKSPRWGFIATPILPVGDTDILGRAGIHVHGGRQPGSAGCLDLIDKNEEFHAFLAGHGPSDGQPGTAPLLLVEYLPTRLTTPRAHANPEECPDGDLIGVENPHLRPPVAGCLEGDKCPFEAAHRKAVLSERPGLLREICTALKA